MDKKLTSVKQKYGIVVLFDALGVRGHDEKQVQGYIHTLQSALEYQDVLREAQAFTAFPLVRSFGDSVLMAWETGLGTGGELDNIIHSVTEISSFFLVQCLLQGTLMRGAMSIGEYHESEQVILGPVVSDVADWYESADWFGCIATPKFYYWLNRRALMGELNSNHDLVLYDVPLKGGRGALNTWCLYWVKTMVSHFGPLTNCWREDFAISLMESIERLDIPKGVEGKYRNVEKFCATFMSEGHFYENYFSKETVARLMNLPSGQGTQ